MTFPKTSRLFLSIVIIFFSLRNGFIDAFAPLSFTPLPNQIATKYVNANTWIKSRNNLKVAPLFSATEPSAAIAAAAVEEISFIEAVFPFLNYIIVSPYKLKQMFDIFTADVSKLIRISSFAALAYVLPSIAQSGRDLLSKGKAGTLLGVEPLQAGGKYETTKWYHCFNHVKQGLYLGAVNDLVDNILDSCVVLGIDMNVLNIISNACSSASFTIWAMFRWRWIKNAILGLVTKRQGQRMRTFWKETSDYFLYSITAMNILNLMGFKYLFALRTISAFGGIGTLVFGLACKEIASQIISGLVFIVQRPFIKGDEIMYGKNSIGKVENVGLMYTTIRDADEILDKIPNSDLTAKTVSNLSKEKRSQVLQQIQFTYDSLDFMPELVAKIKEEIEVSCPKLITNGSSPWRVYFNAYNKGNVEVVVDARFRIQPYSNEYYEVKEKVMNAIARAAKSCGASFK